MSEGRTWAAGEQDRTGRNARQGMGRCSWRPLGVCGCSPLICIAKLVASDGQKLKAAQRRPAGKVGRRQGDDTELFWKRRERGLNLERDKTRRKGTTESVSHVDSWIRRTRLVCTRTAASWRRNATGHVTASLAGRRGGCHICAGIRRRQRGIPVLRGRERAIFACVMGLSWRRNRVLPNIWQYGAGCRRGPRRALYSS